MLRIIESSSAGQAKAYFKPHAADYYIEEQEQELAGQWRGKGAERLGLAGEVKVEAWEALCDNRDPESGKKLTPRQKANRRVGYDFNFHVPKSVSLLYSLTQDERMLDAFRDSVRETMQDIESEMKTRVRKDGRDEDRATGNAVWGEFVHFTLLRAVQNGGAWRSNPTAHGSLRGGGANPSYASEGCPGAPVAKYG